VELEILPLLSRWAHVLAAITIFGGVVFMRMSFVPAAAETGASSELREAMRRRWARLVGPAILFILTSGIYNAILKVKAYELDGVYLTCLTLKLVLGVVVFVLISRLFGRSDKAKKFRERELYWLNVIFAMLLAIVLMAGAMKMDFNPIKDKAGDEASSLTTIDQSAKPITFTQPKEVLWCAAIVQRLY